MLVLTAFVAMDGFGIGRAQTPDQANRFVLERENRTIVLEPYGPNIVRITLSKEKSAALAVPGYGIAGAPSMTGWTREQDSAGFDVIRSGRMVVRIAPENLPAPRPMPLDALNLSLRDHYFGGDDQQNRPYNDTISIAAASGKRLLTMWNWSMVPNSSKTAPANAANPEKADAGYRVAATFDSPAGEHYYGLGQQQQGALDLRDHQVAAGTTTTASVVKMSAFHSWFRAVDTDLSGTIHQRQRLIWALTSRMFGHPKLEIASLSL